MIEKANHVKNRKRSVLVVDDEAINRQLLGFILSEEYRIIYAADGEEALKIINQHSKTLSLILLDLLMPKLGGMDLLKILKKDAELKKIPVIVLTSEASAEVESLRIGAADFIKKPYDVPEVILARVRRIIELSEDRNIIQAAEHDELTSLYTKEFFMEYVKQIDNFESEESMDAVVFNVDHFHLLNEMLGRPYGDLVLQEIANLIKEILSENYGVACRCEADTFHIYCRHFKDYTVLEKLEDELMKRYDQTHIRLRIGIYPDVDKSLEKEKRFDRAKLACDTMKNNIAGKYAFYDNDIHEKELFEERLFNDMQRALDDRQFQIYFQPKYNVQGEEPVLSSAEALIRWNHPEFGLLAPFKFVPLFEKNGMIQKLDRYVWERTAEQIASWKKKYGISMPVSVNVSRIDLYDPDLEKVFLHILDENDLTFQEYHLEITESVYSEDAETIINVIRNLREKGFIIEMDDFGAGYSSLGMVSVMPIDVLKLDMAFAKSVDQNAKNYRMVEIMMDIARFMNVSVIAEGVETEEQYRLMKQAGCDYLQGYYFSKPVPPEEFEKLLERENEEC